VTHIGRPPPQLRVRRPVARGLPTSGTAPSGSHEFPDAQTLSVSFCLPEVVLELLVQPAFGGRVEGKGQSYRRLWGDPRTAVQAGLQRPAQVAPMRRGRESGRIHDVRVGRIDGVRGSFVAGSALEVGSGNPVAFGGEVDGPPEARMILHRAVHAERRIHFTRPVEVLRQWQREARRSPR
jgi:hypothetical protein